MSKKERASAVPADPSQWCEKSKQSLAFQLWREYTDISYKCWRCGVECVFTAQDQQYTFEVKKASVDQRRSLCSACWSESHRIRVALGECEDQWVASKSSLAVDKAFLNKWLELLVRLEEFVPYKPDTAKKNMLGKLLACA
jgi:hypothetical protein